MPQWALRLSLKELKIQMIIDLVTINFKPVAHLTDMSNRHISPAQPGASEIRIYGIDFKIRTSHVKTNLVSQILLRKGKVTPLDSTLCDHCLKGPCFKETSTSQVKSLGYITFTF